MKAVVLAAGEGRRLEPLTNRRPKPMIPVGNRPLLEYVVEAVVEAGVTEIVLVVGYKRQRIQTYFGDGDDWGIDIEYAVQDKQLGTGHAVLQAEPHVDDSFIVLNGDRIVDASLVEALVDAHRDEAGTVMAVTRSDEPSDYGVVTVSGGRVTDLTEKPRADETRSDIINAGVYGFEPSIFDRLREADAAPEGELALTTPLSDLIADDEVCAVRSRAMWADVSYLWDLLSVNASVLDRRDSEREGVLGTGARVADAVALGTDARVGANAVVRRGSSLGDNVTVGANAVVSNAVVFPDATIGDGAVVRDCVVGENAHVGANATVVGGNADVVVDDTVHRDVRLGAVLGDNADLDGGTTVDAGTVVGDGARVQAGVTLDGRVPTDAEVRR